MVVMMAMASVRAAHWLKRCLYLGKICAKAKEHMLDHMVGANAKRVIPNFSRQMAVSQVPGQAHELIRILMPYFDNNLGRGLNSKPPSIFQLQTIPVGHGNRLGKIEKNIFALIRGKANAASMPRVEIESKRACRFFWRPMPGWSMRGSTRNWNVLHSDLNT
jgi:hypothetical protein